MKKDKNRVPKALKEVWAWKEQVYEDTADLNTQDALKRIGEDMEEVKLRYGLTVAAPSRVIAVAEEAGTYRSEEQS